MDPMETPMQDLAQGLDVTAAVFAHSLGGPRLELVVVHLEADTGETWAAEAVARGYQFVGTYALVKGEPRVTIEPGDGHALAMVYAGTVFAGMLGPLLKEAQLKAAQVGADAA